jgi:hypothetical protein
MPLILAKARSDTNKLDKVMVWVAIAWGYMNLHSMLGWGKRCHWSAFIFSRASQMRASCTWLERDLHLNFCTIPDGGCEHQTRRCPSLLPPTTRR